MAQRLHYYITMKTIKKLEWFAVKGNGELYKKGYTKTRKGARAAKDRADQAYGANLSGKLIVYYTDGTIEHQPLF